MLINQRKHHRNQLGPVGALAPKAVGPYKIKKQITQNTFEIDIPPAVRKKMRPVFHSSELIPFETRELDPVGALPPREGADNPDLLPEEEAELERASRAPGDSPAGAGMQQPPQVDQQFGDAPHAAPPAEQVIDQQFGQAAPPAAWDLNAAAVEDPFEIYYFQTVEVVVLPPEPPTLHARVRFERDVTVLQLPPLPQEEWHHSMVGEQCMGFVLSSDCSSLEEKMASIPVWEQQLGRYRLCQAAAEPHPSFEQNEEVSLCHTIFLAMCQNFEVYPEVDMFASARQHQLPRYYTADPHDQNAEGYNAFNFNWSPGLALYINPPWSLLDQVVDKIVRDGTRGLVVAPHWPEARWFRRLQRLPVEQHVWRQPLYLETDGRLRRLPKWATVFVYLPGAPT